MRFAGMLMGGCAMLGSLPLADAAQLRDLRLWDEPESTRVVLDLQGAVAHQVFTLDHPHRVVIDLPGVNGSSLDIARRVTAAGIVNAVRSAPRGDGIRVVLDLQDSVYASSFDLPSTQADPRLADHQLVVELARPVASAPESAGHVPAATAATRPAPIVAAPAAPVVATPLAAKPEARAGVATKSQTSKPLIIAIDAGHGGQDPGAIGPSGLREKDVTLAVARKLAARINKTPGMKAVLTRDSDRFVDLRGRINVARKHQADLFVSVHCNAFTRKDMHGTAVYVLSDKGASNEHARWLAHKENSADLVGGVHLEGKDKDLAAVLIDISQSATREASFDVGDRILKAMGQVNRLQKPRLQEAGFVVLKAPDIPSVLVETAFITNPREEKLLASDRFRDQLAAQIQKGVLGYFDAYRPQQQLVEDAPRAIRVSHTPATAAGETHGIMQ